MSTSGIPAGDGQIPAPASPSLGQLKEALRVLEQTHYLFNNMKQKVVYACGEGHLLASDEGRQYLSRVIKSLDDEHRTLRVSWPRLTASLEVARAVSKVAAARQSARAAAAAGGRSPHAAAASGGGAPGRSSPGAPAAPAGSEAAVAATAAAALQSHCRSVSQQLQAALCEQVLAAGGGAMGALGRGHPAKRPRTGDLPPGPTSTSYAAPLAATSPATATAPSPSSPGPSVPTPAPAATPSAAAPTFFPASEGPLQLLGVLLRLRTQDGGTATGAHPSSASGGGPPPGGVGSLASMRLHVLDDVGNPLSLPSALTAALAAPAGGGSASISGGGGSAVPLVDGALWSAGASRLVNATQVRLLVPGVYVANVLLESPGCPVPLRVVVNAADRAFDLDPWATPSTEVFRRVSALATRVLTYYVKRAPLSAAPPPPHPATTATTSNTTASSPQVPAPPPGPSPLPSEPHSPGAAALEDLLLWLLGCRDLFSKRCAATGRLLALDPSVQYPVPPIFRPFKLPREELRLRAVDLSRVPAFHMHVAPLEQLGWAEDVAGGAAAW